MSPLRELLHSTDKSQELYDQLTDWGILSFTSPGSFFAKAVIMYLILYWGYQKVKNWVLIVLLIIGIFAGVYFRAFVEEFLLVFIRGEGNYHPDTT
ncbi:MAG: hypothetical protein AAFR97_07965, partial [Bacteroidota bacterium]